MTPIGPGLPLLAVSVVWGASEIGLAALRRSGAGASRRDESSLALSSAFPEAYRACATRTVRPVPGHF